LWEPTTGDIDFYYWYYATLSMFQVGGPRWDKWNAALKIACIDHQRLNKDQLRVRFRGIRFDPWSRAGGARLFDGRELPQQWKSITATRRFFGMPKLETKKEPGKQVARDVSRSA